MSVVAYVGVIESIYLSVYVITKRYVVDALQSKENKGSDSVITWERGSACEGSE